jgi:hypothetical protein
MKQLVALCFLFCQTALGQTVIVTELAELPSTIYETSGLENGPDGCFWTHNDSGNGPQLYCVDTTGTIQRTVSIFGDQNTDWEELTKDNDGNLYIGNCGNNELNRTDLRIVKVPSVDTCTATTYVTDTIRFSYPDQVNFPPAGDYGNFDMEAMFWHQDSLHLFSKDRSDPSTGFTKHYTLPTEGGSYTANLVDSFEVENPSFFLAITAADINEDGTEMVLLSADKIWLFNNFNSTNYFGGDVSVLNLSVFSQKEGICYRNGFLYITDEQSFGLGGKIYRVDTRLFVSVEEREEPFCIKAIYNHDYTLDKVILRNDSPTGWKLFSSDGKLIQTGSSSTQILRNEFLAPAGIYVLQLARKGNATSSNMLKL